MFGTCPERPALPRSMRSAPGVRRKSRPANSVHAWFRRSIVCRCSSSGCGSSSAGWRWTKNPLLAYASGLFRSHRTQQQLQQWSARRRALCTRSPFYNVVRYGAVVGISSNSHGHSHYDNATTRSNGFTSPVAAGATCSCCCSLNAPACTCNPPCSFALFLNSASCSACSSLSLLSLSR